MKCNFVGAKHLGCYRDQHQGPEPNQFSSFKDFLDTKRPIFKEAKDMAGVGRTWNFGPSLMTKDMIEALEKEGYFGVGKAKPP